MEELFGDALPTDAPATQVSPSAKSRAKAKAVEAVEAVEAGEDGDHSDQPEGQMGQMGHMRFSDFQIGVLIISFCSATCSNHLTWHFFRVAI